MTFNFDSIPDWDYDGILPAINWSDPTSLERSPYTISIIDLVMYLGKTEARRRLLEGLLDFRAALYQAGLVEGFQWIDGSFVENVEERESRSPEDIDLVIFFYIPEGYTGETLLRDFPALFDNSSLKNNYSVDAYFMPLNQVPPKEVINHSVYWYGLWSHTRDGRWKGYLEVDLAGADDMQARSEIERLGNIDEGWEVGRT